MGGERLDIPKEMANPPPLQNPMTYQHYGELPQLVNRLLMTRHLGFENAAKTGIFVIFLEFDRAVLKAASKSR
jgi:hypothetical protein